MRDRYYLDYNATTPLDPAVREAMAPYFEGELGNASSLHAEGRRARAAVDSARDEVAAWLMAKPSEIIFTGGGTESNNLALQGLAHAHSSRGKHLITVATEHHAVLHTFRMLEKRYGFKVSYLGVDPNGLIDLDELKAAISEETILVSVMSANNETGVKQPMREIGQICADRKILFHTDAVQSAGKEPLFFKEWQVSAASLTAHKFYGPVGAGVLYLCSGISIERLMEGGSHETERRPGTENVAGIVGLAKASQIARKKMAESTREFKLIEFLWNQLSSLAGIRRNGDPKQRISNTLNVSFKDLHGEDLLIGLDLEGLAVSSGSACLVGSIQLSHVLTAMKVPANEAAATVRFSIGTDMVETDLLEIARRVKKVVNHQRGLFTNR